VDRFRDLFTRFIEIAPFVAMTMNGSNKPKVSINWTDLIQTVLVSALVGALSAYVSLKILEIKHNTLETAVISMKAENVSSFNDIKTRLNDICSIVGSTRERVTVLEIYQDDRLVKEHKTIRRPDPGHNLPAQ
jgi:hypothetical protein